jgi:hypothetical protein
MKNIKINTGMSFEKVRKMIQDCWWKTEQKDNTVLYTGIEGKINFQEQIVKSVGGEFTEEDREKLRQELINSGQTIFKL